MTDNNQNQAINEVAAQAVSEAQQATSTAQQITEMMAAFWATQMQEIEQGHIDFKVQNLPLARIKKVMKSDEDVKVLSFLT